MTHNLQADGVPELTLGWRIQMALAAGGLKQTDLMSHFELSRGTISRWCRDEGVPPKRHQVMQIALMTGVNPHWLETGNAPTGTGPDGGAESGNYGLKVRSSTQLSYRGTSHDSNVIPLRHTPHRRSAA